MNYRYAAKHLNECEGCEDCDFYMSRMNACDCCGNWFNKDDTYYHDDTGETLCEKCEHADIEEAKANTALYPAALSETKTAIAPDLNGIFNTADGILKKLYTDIDSVYLLSDIHLADMGLSRMTEPKSRKKPKKYPNGRS